MYFAISVKLLCNFKSFRVKNAFLCLTLLNLILRSHIETDGLRVQNRPKKILLHTIHRTLIKCGVAAGLNSFKRVLDRRWRIDFKLIAGMASWNLSIQQWHIRISIAADKLKRWIVSFIIRELLATSIWPLWEIRCWSR